MPTRYTVENPPKLPLTYGGKLLRRVLYVPMCVGRQVNNSFSLFCFLSYLRRRVSGIRKKPTHGHRRKDSAWPGLANILQLPFQPASQPACLPRADAIGIFPLPQFYHGASTSTKGACTSLFLKNWRVLHSESFRQINYRGKWIFLYIFLFLHYIIHKPLTFMIIL